mgnify:CR=1 FL=1
MRSRQSDRKLQKHLLLIHCHSNDFPNAGSLLVALDKYYRRLSKTKNVWNITQLISIAVDISFVSPRCFPVCALIISDLISRYTSSEEKIDALRRVRAKLAQLPNNGHLEVWQQRISHPFDTNVTYTESLCSIVKGEKADLWNNKWITDKRLKDVLDARKVVNRSRLNKMNPVMPHEEISLFVWDS